MDLISSSIAACENQTASILGLLEIEVVLWVTLFIQQLTLLTPQLLVIQLISPFILPLNNVVQRVIVTKLHSLHLPLKLLLMYSLTRQIPNKEVQVLVIVHVHPKTKKSVRRVQSSLDQISCLPILFDLRDCHDVQHQLPRGIIPSH